MPDAPSEILMDNHVTNCTISPGDRETLRELASRVAQLASRDIEAEKKKLWTDHNGLRHVRPLVFCDPENGWNEIIRPTGILCEGDLARNWEYGLRKEIFWGETMNDDRVIEPWFTINWIYTRSGWGLMERNIGGTEGGARTWEAPVKEMKDLENLQFQALDVDYEATDKLTSLAEEVFSGILPVRNRTGWNWTYGLTWECIKLRGLEQMMIDMYENPELLHALMAFLRDGTLDFIRKLDDNGLFTLNNEGDYVGSGGFGWTTELPKPGFTGKGRAKDIWALSESQETVGVSPDMFAEFVFPYQAPIMEMFGLICYGCCEPVDTRWHVLKQIPNLRRVSVSPWCNRERMAENLQADYIYSLKPHPGLLAGSNFDENIVRADVKEALEKARGCHVEIIMKDNHTICNDPSRVINWVRIVREEIESNG